MSYLRGVERTQVQLLPACVEDYVRADAPVRFLDAFVEGLDLQALGFKHALPADTGRPPYHPGDLLRLYLYGYLNRIRSSRRLEAEGARNLELIWLLGGIRPDFKTIADFRKDNKAAFKPLFRQFNLLCRKLELFGAELSAIDGAKFKAGNNRRRNYNRAELKELRQKIDERIEEYLNRLDRQDQEATGVAAGPTAADLQAKIAQLRERQGRYEQMLKELDASEQSEVSLSDPDSRAQKKVGVGYNVQAAVDAKHYLIVEQEVVQDANDRGQLAPMAQAAKQALGVEKLKVVADAGYHEAEQLEQCEQAGIETYVSRPATSAGQNGSGKAIYPKSMFTYDVASDTYQCPAGQRLYRGHQSQSKGKERVYYYHVATCSHCPHRSACTDGRHRSISRLVNEAVVERQEARSRANPQVLQLRKTIVEHVFGTLRNWQHEEFLLRGLAKVRAEFSLSCLVYNLRRVMSLVSLDKWVEVLKRVTGQPKLTSAQ